MVKKYYCAVSPTEKHLLTAIKSQILINKSVCASWTSRCSHLTKTNPQNFRDCKTLAKVSLPTCNEVWVTEHILTCKSGLKQAFHWPLLKTWVGSWNAFLNSTWPDLEDFSVIIPLGRVDSHVRREVEEGLPRAVMRAHARQQWFVPGAKREVEIGGTLQSKVHILSDYYKWKGGGKKKRGLLHGSCRPNGQHLRCRRVSFPSSCSLSLVPQRYIALLLCWTFLSFDSCAWSAVTAVWREGCVCVAMSVR